MTSKLDTEPEKMVFEADTSGITVTQALFIGFSLILVKNHLHVEGGEQCLFFTYLLSG